MASMCKHVAAALYGAAVRLDQKPELFFVLRGIKIDDFVGKMVRRESEKMLRKAKAKSSRVIEGEAGDMSRLFGIATDGVRAADKEKPQAASLGRKTVKPGTTRPRKSLPRQPAGRRKV